MTGILNLNKWAEKTAQAVREICGKKQAPCVGFSLVFFDPTAQEEERWNYVIELAYDPRDPPNEEERAQVQKTFEFIGEGIRMLMGGEFEVDPEDFTARGSFH